MKINLISDVHATLDPEDNFKVLYAEKQKYTKDKCLKTIDALAKFAHSEIPDQTFTHIPSETEKFLYKKAPTSHQEYLALVDGIASKFPKSDDLSIREKETLVDEINGVDHWHFLLGESGHFEKRYGLAVDLSDVASWLMKTYSTFDPSRLEPADYLVIAGDLGLLPTEDKILEDIKKKTAGKFKDILYIAGNHSHWWHRTVGLSEEKPSSIDLSHDYCERVDGDWMFLGCTLWTPIPEKSSWRISRHMNDYNYIPGFNTRECTRQFEIQSSWLRSKVEANKDKKIVIFTHHQPFRECIRLDAKHNDPWSDGDVAEAYADLDDTLKDINHAGNVKIWLCGHTHMPFDQEVYGMRVVRNPIGYSDFYMYGFGASECDPANWYNKVIDLDKDER